MFCVKCICGQTQDFAVLRSSDGKTWLVCSDCETEYSLESVVNDLNNADPDWIRAGGTIQLTPYIEGD